MSDFHESDWGAQLKRYQHEDVHIDFTPMIDCMFLLLMFNMIAYTITGSSELDIPQARHAQAPDTHEAVEVTLRAPREGQARALIQIRGLEKEDDNADASADDVREAVRRAVGKGRMQVVIKSEKKVLIRDMMDVATKVGEFEGTTLHLAVKHAE